MRELTKSMMSFSWSLSVFGLRQLTRLVTPRSWDTARASFDHLAHSTEDQLGSVTRSLYRTGDALQRGMVDMAVNVLSLGMSGSGRGDGAPPAAGGPGGAAPTTGPLPGGR
jgi:hypothetical protein